MEILVWRVVLRVPCDRFKIDGIVWKLGRFLENSIECSSFKIDGIVWKSWWGHVALGLDSAAAIPSHVRSGDLVVVEGLQGTLQCSPPIIDADGGCKAIIEPMMIMQRINWRVSAEVHIITCYTMREGAICSTLKL